MRGGQHDATATYGARGEHYWSEYTVRAAFRVIPLLQRTRTQRLVGRRLLTVLFARFVIELGASYTVLA